ncbi:beta-lactamase family protein [Pseudomonadales bacterium]|nr:beta-lactamase family protein [Pseudomonadales bacterium]
MKQLIFCAAILLMPLWVHAQKNADLLGSEHILFWTPDQQQSGYSSIADLGNTRLIKASENILNLPTSGGSLAGFQHSYKGNASSIDDFMQRTRAAGLLVIHDQQIALEKYALGHAEDKPWISFSVSKSVVSMLIGAAIKDGLIKDVNELVTDYLPHLKGGAYADVRIKDLLQMASGAAWNEDYADPDSDVGNAPYGPPALYTYMSGLEKRSPAGEVFNYNTGETSLAGALLRAAVGNNLSVYLQRKIWQPFGMESDANWLLSAPNGEEIGGCCISATLRDYGRLGLFALANGRLKDGTAILPEDWMSESVAASKGSKGYGYYWWLQKEGAYAAEGVFGQFIWIDPKRNVVIAMQSAWPSAWEDGYEVEVIELFQNMAAWLDAH